MITFKIKNTCEKGVKEKMSEGRRTKITVQIQMRKIKAHTGKERRTNERRQKLSEKSYPMQTEIGESERRI